MDKINLKYLIILTSVIIAFLIVNIIISLISIPKYLNQGQSIIDLNFNENINLDNYLLNYKQYLFEYSNEGVSIENSIGLDNSTALIFNANNNEKFIHFVIDNNNYMFLKLTAFVKFDKIKKNNEKYPAFWLYNEDNKGKLHWEIPHVVKNFFSLFKWKKIEDYFYIPSFASKIHFVISNNSISGKMICDDISLTPYKMNYIFKIFRLIVFIIFFIFLLIVIYIFRKFIFKFFKQISILIIIFIGILGPKRYLYMIATYFHLNELYIQKTGHFIMFSLLGFFIYINKKYFENDKNFKLFLIIELVLIADLTEMLQFFTFSRTMSFYDCLIDSSGIILGILSADIINFFKKQVKINH